MRYLLFLFLSSFLSITLIGGCSSGGEDCEPQADTYCDEGVTHWLDSCGEIGLKKEDCEAGCLPDHSDCADYECMTDNDCDAGYFCDLTVHECKEETCVLDCAGKCCGSDGCDGQCTDTCPVGWDCIMSTCQCEAECTPDCGSRECGMDPVCGTLNCGTCSEPTPDCNAQGQCVGNCTPDCGIRECGLDPVCDTLSCGTCPGAFDYCTVGGQCVDDCAGRECGTSPNEGFDCGTCSVGYFCCSGSCEEIVDTAVCWVSIPGGTFMMGSDSFHDAQPVHQVTVPSFEISRTEITVAQYKPCVDAGVCPEPTDCGSAHNWSVAGRENHPINCMNWQEAVDFCTWAGGRIQSEAEWEYAARSGGQDLTYPWGEDSPSCVYVVWEEGGFGCGEYHTWPVCSKTAGNTQMGLCDMAGNVDAWVQDWYHLQVGYDGAPADGSAWEDPVDNMRVLRGGSYQSDDMYEYFNTSFRGNCFPNERFTSVGIRCARGVP